MRKQECFHLHGLLLAVARYRQEREGLPASMLDEYDALGVRPSSVQRSKQDHHDAVVALAAANVAWIDAPGDAEREPVTR